MNVADLRQLLKKMETYKDFLSQDKDKQLFLEEGKIKLTAREANIIRKRIEREYKEVVSKLELLGLACTD